MYRLIKNLHYPSSKFYYHGVSTNKIDTFFKVSKMTFFKKTNYLMKKDYYSKNEFYFVRNSWCISFIRSK